MVDSVDSFRKALGKRWKDRSGVEGGEIEDVES